MTTTFPRYLKAASVGIAALVFLAVALPILDLSARIVA